MKRTTELKRTGFKRKPAAESKRSGMRQESKKHRARRKGWRKLLNEWLKNAPNHDPRCQLCGSYISDSADPHHIKRRGQGGDDSPGNMAGLHPDCHMWLHDNSMSAVTALARERLAAFAAAGCNLTNYQVAPPNLWRTV